MRVGTKRLTLDVQRKASCHVERSRDISYCLGMRDSSTPKAFGARNNKWRAKAFIEVLKAQ